MKKRMISLLLCAMMLIGLLPMNALALATTSINPEDGLIAGNCVWEDSGYTCVIRIQPCQPVDGH